MTDTAETDLNALMQEDPLNLTDANINSIVAAMRERRHRFNQGDTRAGSAKPRVAKALKGLDAETLDVEIKL